MLLQSSFKFFTFRKWIDATENHPSNISSSIDLYDTCIYAYDYTMIIIYTMKDFIQIITEIFIRITLGVISLQDISTYNANVFPTIRVLEETLTRLKITETKNKIFHFIILYYNLMPFV